MDPVALAATIGGSTVGFAGIAATAWSNRQQRESARELASLEREHERKLARGARLYERRVAVYEEMLTLLNVWVDRVDATERVWSSPTDPEPPELPDPDKWRAMQARLASGSLEVSDAYREFSVAIREFYDRVAELRFIMQGHVEGDAGAAATKMDDARRGVRDTMRRLERLVSEELARL